MQYRRRSGYFGFISDSEPGMALLLIWLSVWRTPVKGVSSFLDCVYGVVCQGFSDVTLGGGGGLPFSAVFGSGRVFIESSCRWRSVTDASPDVRICRVSNVRNVWCEAKTPLPQHLHNPTRQRERAQSRMIRSNGDVQIQKPAQRNRNFVNLIDRCSFRIGGNEICYVDEVVAQPDRQIARAGEGVDGVPDDRFGELSYLGHLGVGGEGDAYFFQERCGGGADHGFDQRRAMRGCCHDAAPNCVETDDEAVRGG